MIFQLERWLEWKTISRMMKKKGPFQNTTISHCHLGVLRVYSWLCTKISTRGEVGIKPGLPWARQPPYPRARQPPYPLGFCSGPHPGIGASYGRLGVLGTGIEPRSIGRSHFATSPKTAEKLGSETLCEQRKCGLGGLELAPAQGWTPDNFGEMPQQEQNIGKRAGSWTGWSFKLLPMLMPCHWAPI